MPQTPGTSTRPTRHHPTLARLCVAFGAAAAALLAACGKDKTTKPVPVDYISPRLEPADVVKNLQMAYKKRNVQEYAKLLASDFQFWFDPATRPTSIPEFWTRLQDSTGTSNLFTASDVSDIRVTLTYGDPVPDLTIGHTGWKKIRVTDTFLEVDKQPEGGGEVITLRVDGDVQEFYLRKGRTPADTLASSPTAKEWFLVEWHDLARLSAATRGGALAGATATTPAATASTATTPAAADQSTTWGGIKGLYSK